MGGTPVVSAPRGSGVRRGAGRGDGQSTAGSAGQYVDERNLRQIPSGNSMCLPFHLPCFPCCSLPYPLLHLLVLLCPALTYCRFTEASPTQLVGTRGCDCAWPPGEPGWLHQHNCRARRGGTPSPASSATVRDHAVPPAGAPIDLPAPASHVTISSGDSVASGVGSVVSHSPEGSVISIRSDDSFLQLGVAVVRQLDGDLDRDSAMSHGP